MPVFFNTADIQFSLPQKSRLKQFLAAQLLVAGKKSVHLRYIFCSDEYLLELNKKFLNHDYYTDIITFPLSETPNSLESEIYISIDRVKENAQKLKVDFKDELCRVIFHGALHLTGFKDKSKADKILMREKEEEWLEKFLRFENPSS